MADRKISDLTALTTPASGDYLPIVDISEAAAASKNKRITIEELMRGVPDGTAAAPGIAFETDPNTGIYSPGADQLAVATNGAGRLFVDASGNVGVGTSAPAAILSTKPSASSTTGATTFTGDGLYIDCANTTDGNGNYGGAISWSRSGSSTTRAAAITNVQTASDSDVQGLAFLTHSSTTSTNALIEAMRITGLGNVGIGDTAPDSTLTIKAATSVVPLRVSGPSSEFARIDTSGRLLVGTSTSTGVGALVQVRNDTGNNHIEIIRSSDNASNPAMWLSKSRGSAGSPTVISSGDALGYIAFRGFDGTIYRDGAYIGVESDGTPGANDMPARLLFFTTADGSGSPTERLRITSAGVLQIADAGNITVGTTTGTKIGTATTQKLGFYNATPVVQPAAVADATDAASVIARLNDLLARLRTLGIIAT